MIPHIKTAYALIITGPEGIPLQVGIDHNNFEAIVDIVENQYADADTYRTLEDLIRPVAKVIRIAESHSDYFASDDYGNLTCTVGGSEFRLPKNLSVYVLSLYEAEKSLVPLLNFVRKLAKNPRREVIDELWGFISSCGLSLTEDGNFLAYKNVNTDFTSVWDSTTDNSPGTVLEMRRSDVEHDPDRTCSYGLHFAAWGYLSSYAPGRKTVLLSIDPEDVVSIPSDYQNMKGRACRYQVLREVEQPEELKHRPVFRMDDEDYDDEDYDEDEYDDPTGSCPECDADVYDDDDECSICRAWL